MLRSFLSKNAVIMVMVPVLFGAHYGWYKLQTNENLVSVEDRNKLPGPIAKVNTTMNPRGNIRLIVPMRKAKANLTSCELFST